MEDTEFDVLGQAAARMLEADTFAERMSAVQEILDRRPDCGLPYLVLAREGAADEAAAEQFYRKAIGLLWQEYRRFSDDNANDYGHEDEPYLLEDEGFVLIIGEFARYLWRRELREEAIKTLLEAIDEFCDEAESLGFLAASYLIRSGSEEQAASIIAKAPDSTAQWHYMNALLLFRAEGDTPVSRAAVRHAISESRPIGRLL